MIDGRATGWRVLCWLPGLLIVSCVGNDGSLPTEPEPGQSVLFHVGYVNYAWHPVSQGMYVDTDGMVWSLPSAVSWGAEIAALFEGRLPDFSYPEGEIDQAYVSRRDSILTVLPVSEVREMFGLVGAVAGEGYSERTSTARDAGMMVTGALLYDRDKGEYRKVVFAITGDWTVFNLSTAATELDSWLKGILVQAAPPGQQLW